MKFRVSLVESKGAEGAAGVDGNLGNAAGNVMNQASSVAMNFVSNSSPELSTLLGGGNNQNGGIILSPDEITGVSYNTSSATGELLAGNQNEITLVITGKMLSHIDENDDFEGGGSGKEAMLGGLMGSLGLGTLYNKYNEFKGIKGQVESIFGSDDDENNGEEMKLKGLKNDEMFKQSPEFQSNMENVLGKEDKLKSMGFGDLFGSSEDSSDILKGSSLLSSSGITANEEKSSSNDFGKIAKQVLGVSSMIPLTRNFANGVGGVLGGMFGSKGGNFGLNNLYDINKQNIIALSQWAMVYGEDMTTKDVLIQADLGNGNVYELFFPRMFVENYNQSFDIETGEGYFNLYLKQSRYKENDIELK